MAIKLPTKEQVLKYAPLALLAFGAFAWLVTLGGEFFLKFEFLIFFLEKTNRSFLFLFLFLFFSG